MIRRWEVLVEGAPAGDEASDENIVALVASLKLIGGAAAKRGNTVAATVPVEAESARAAAGVAESLVLLHARQAGLRAFRALRLEAVDTASSLLSTEAETGEILGSAEVARLLGVSRQRVQQLRAEGRFPAPLLELSATPVWLRRSVETFITSWSRRPGRPPGRATRSPLLRDGRPEGLRR